jgi:hypothetical protein
MASTGAIGLTECYRFKDAHLSKHYFRSNRSRFANVLTGKTLSDKYIYQQNRLINLLNDVSRV